MTSPAVCPLNLWTKQTQMFKVLKVTTQEQQLQQFLFVLFFNSVLTEFFFDLHPLRQLSFCIKYVILITWTNLCYF